MKARIWARARTARVSTSFEVDVFRSRGADTGARHLSSFKIAVIPLPSRGLESLILRKFTPEKSSPACRPRSGFARSGVQGARLELLCRALPGALGRELSFRGFFKGLGGLNGARLRGGRCWRFLKVAQARHLV